MKQKIGKRKMNKCTVTIFNEEYVVKGQADRSHIEKVSTYVDRMMKQISQKILVFPQTISRVNGHQRYR